MNKAEIVRDISGIEETVTTVCPKCKKSGQQSLPVEYVESRDAWRTKSGCLIVMCYTCYQNRTDKPWGYT